MKRPTPNIETLLAADLSEPEREQLQRAHEALLRAGPPPPLPRSLRHPPQLDHPPAASIRSLPPLQPARRRRRRRLVLAAAATIAAAAAAAASYLASAPTGEPVKQAVTLHATPAAPQAKATLTVGSLDQAGNRLITLHLHGLPRLAAGSYYEMYLTNKGHTVAACGAFRTDPGTTTVHLNVPYHLNEYSGWTIRLQSPHQPPSAPLLTT